MSSGRRSSSRQTSGSSKITDDQIIELVSKLHHVLPEIRTPKRSNKATANKVLQETCNHIRSLHSEMDDLSARLSQLLSAVDDDSPEAAIIRTLI